MARGKKQPQHEVWRDHLENNLDEMAKSWSRVKKPAERVIKLLAGKRAGSSVEITPELKEKLMALKKALGHCPLIVDGPRNPCFGPPADFGRRSVGRKPRSS